MELHERILTWISSGTVVISLGVIVAILILAYISIFKKH